MIVNRDTGNLLRFQMRAQRRIWNNLKGNRTIQIAAADKALKLACVLKGNHRRTEQQIVFIFRDNAFNGLEYRDLIRIREEPIRATMRKDHANVVRAAPRQCSPGETGLISHFIDDMLNASTRL